MESSPFHAVNFCRDSRLDILPWPACSPFPSHHVVFPSLCPSFFTPSKSPLFVFPSLSPLTKSWLGEQQRGLSLRGLTAAKVLVASCVVKCLFGMQSCEQPPSPPSPPRALRQWASICKAKLQSSLGNDLPVLYSRWLEAESTPLPLSSVPTYISKRWLFLPYSCFQPKEAREVTYQREDAMGVILSPQTAAVGSDQKRQIHMPATCMGRKEMASSL